MKKIIITVIVLVFMNISNADSKIHRFQNKIKKVCNEADVSLLLLKKSLIEMIKGEECSGKFTSIVINKCSTLNCQQLTEIYKDINQVRSGSVVGDN